MGGMQLVECKECNWWNAFHVRNWWNAIGGMQGMHWWNGILCKELLECKECIWWNVRNAIGGMQLGECILCMELVECNWWNAFYVRNWWDAIGGMHFM